MERLTVEKRKSLLEKVIRDRTGGRLTEQELFIIMTQLNINNQYTVEVIDNPTEFELRATATNIHYYEDISKDIYEDGQLVRLRGDNYLGGQEQRVEVLLGSSIKPGEVDYYRYDDFRKNYNLEQETQFDEDETSAVLVQTINNYLSSDGADRKFYIRYDIIVYLPPNRG